MLKKIHELYPRQMAEALNELTPHATPISDARHLKGREQQMREVEQAIYAAGRHVFIYGERGVGKTSLAKTTALVATGNRAQFKQIGCSTDVTFQELIRQVLQSFDAELLKTVSRERGWSVAKFIGYNSKTTTTTDAISKLTASDAADILADVDCRVGASEFHVVLVDETDRLSSEEAKRQLAELVKLLGDRGARFTLIFTGVGQDLQSILGYHPSSFRQLAQIHLERLHYQAALDIIDDVLHRFGLDWEQEPVRTIRFRIASIANGFPYYVHLLMEKLIYTLYHDKDASSLTADHLRGAVLVAVREAAEEIRKPYDQATRGRASLYKHIVWAMADSWDLERDTGSIYQSYCDICKQIGETAVTQTRMTQVLSAMKKPAYGCLFVAGYRKGIYRFSENIVRGYVRMCAEAEGVELLEAMPYDPPANHMKAREKRYVDPRRYSGPPKLL